jgi:hypothetical protein
MACGRRKAMVGAMVAWVACRKHKYYTYKAHHEKTLAQHTITTNGGVLKYLMWDAAGQEAKEFVVAYTLLALAERPMSVEGLRAAANALLKSAGLELIEFDAEDALVELEKLGLLVRDGGTLYGVAGLPALQHAVSLAEFQSKVVGKCAPLASTLLSQPRARGFVLVHIPHACRHLARSDVHPPGNAELHLVACVHACICLAVQCDVLRAEQSCGAG